jgi:hypothetical protein
MMIRRRVAKPEPSAPVEVKEVAEKANEDGGEGFLARNSVDFFTNDDAGDFVPDNELTLRDEIYAQYEETLGERVAESHKSALNAMAKLENTLAGL